MESIQPINERRVRNETLGKGEVYVHELALQKLNDSDELRPHAEPIHARFLPTADDIPDQSLSDRLRTYATVHEGSRYIVRESDLRQMRKNTGGYGCVIFARDVQTGESLAIKFLRPDKQKVGSTSKDMQSEKYTKMQERSRLLYREFRTTQHLRSSVTPHVVDTRDQIVFANINGLTVPGMIMERLQPLPRTVHAQEVVSMVQQVAEGLDAVHEQGIIHYDIKPDNIMKRGETYVLTDFGGCYNRNERLQGPFTFSEAYSDPQILAENKVIKESGHEVSPGETMPYRAPVEESSMPEQADQFALALTAYELMFHTDPRHAFTRIDGQQQLRSGVGIDPGVLAVLRRATSAHRENRYPDCRTFAQELSNAMERRNARSMSYTELPKRILRTLLGR